MAGDQAAEHAIDTVARRLVARAVERALEFPLVEWCDYPELGEHDWNAVVARAQALAERGDVQGEKYEDAYRFLAGRADPEPTTPTRDEMR